MDSEGGGVRRDVTLQIVGRVGVSERNEGGCERACVGMESERTVEGTCSLRELINEMKSLEKADEILLGRTQRTH